MLQLSRCNFVQLTLLNPQFAPVDLWGKTVCSLGQRRLQGKEHFLINLHNFIRLHKLIAYLFANTGSDTASFKFSDGETTTVLNVGKKENNKSSVALSEKENDSSLWENNWNKLDLPLDQILQNPNLLGSPEEWKQFLGYFYTLD